MDNKKVEFKSIAIIGLGLLGSSLAMALKNKGVKILGWTRRQSVVKKALSEGVINKSGELSAILNEADITVLCLPIPQIMEFIKNNSCSWRPGAIVTDIGSVKSVIVGHGESLLTPLGVHFVGSHPMAGTEKTGPEAAFSSLYDNAEVFVTQTKTTNLAAMQQVMDLWTLVNTKVVTIDPQIHDELVAHTSHISHLLALALTETVLDCSSKEELSARFSGCATGFKDTSRITSSSPLMWREILENNQAAMLKVAAEFEQRWSYLKSLLVNKHFDQLENEFRKGKTLRDSWIKYKNEQHDCQW